MSKPEIQPSATDQFRVGDVGGPLVLGHGVPDTVALLVAPDVVDLGEEEEHDGEGVEGEEDAVARLVERLVVVEVDEVADDVAGLDGHLLRLRDRLVGFFFFFFFHELRLGGVDLYELGRGEGERGEVVFWGGEGGHGLHCTLLLIHSVCPRYWNSGTPMRPGLHLSIICGESLLPSRLGRRSCKTYGSTGTIANT